jgi:hypothetical protein
MVPPTKGNAVRATFIPGGGQRVDDLVEDRPKRVQDGTVMARPAVQTSSDAPSDLIERGDELSVLGESVTTSDGDAGPYVRSAVFPTPASPARKTRRPRELLRTDHPPVRRH